MRKLLILIFAATMLQISAIAQNVNRQKSLEKLQLTQQKSATVLGTDAAGNVVDNTAEVQQAIQSSTPDLTPYAKSAEVDSKLNAKADKSNTYTTAEVDSKLSTKADIMSVYNKQTVDALIENGGQLFKIKNTGKYGYSINKLINSVYVGDYSLNLSNNSVATGMYSTVISGMRSKATGYSAGVLQGFMSLADGHYSLCLGGERLSSKGRYSVAIGGKFNTAWSRSEVVIGENSTDYVPYGGTSNLDPRDRVLTIGNGMSYTSRSDALIIYKTGNMDLNGLLKLKPMAAPTTAQKGMIYFDSTDNKLKCYDGVVWHNLF